MTVNRKTMRLLLLSIVLGFLSIALPWWTFIFSRDGSLVSTFNLFLFGIVKTGFLKASLSFEWWSYATCAFVAIGACIGLIGHRLLVLGKENGRKLVAVDLAFTISGCLLYVVNLTITLAAPFTSSQDFWMTAPTQGSNLITIALLNVFGIRSLNISGAVVVLEFLSIGFVFAVTSFSLLLVTMYRLSRVLLPAKNPVLAQANHQT
jgi:hypothetical protein